MGRDTCTLGCDAYIFFKYHSHTHTHFPHFNHIHTHTQRKLSIPMTTHTSNYTCASLKRSQYSLVQSSFQ
ncbi:hypothetical protein EON63_15225 [archaeon]|nr:MAG: hypothetical protein EON63_15225 [archaeon]